MVTTYISISVALVGLTAQTLTAQQTAQSTQSDVVIEQSQPVPVVSVPGPESVANYGIQGLVIGTILTLGKPLIEKLGLWRQSKDKLEEQTAVFQQTTTQAQYQAWIDSDRDKMAFIKELTLRPTEQGSRVNAVEAKVTALDPLLVSLQDTIRGQQQSLQHIGESLASLDKTTKSLEEQVQRYDKSYKDLDDRVRMIERNLYSPYIPIAPKESP